MTTYCCPIVHTLVVIQYTISPAGKLMMIGTKISGKPNMIIRWVRSAVAIITSPAPSWVAT